MSVELVTRKKTVANEYVAVIGFENWTSSDLDLIAAYGDPIVDVGGDFDDSATTFSLDTNEVRLMRDFPFTQRFDATDDEEAEAKRDLWVETITDRVIDALTELRAQSASISSRTITTI